MSITTAVILAAGLGSRLKERTQHRPKGFLEVDGIPLIERSIQTLIKKGFTRIVIGTGYLNEFFDALKKRYPQIETARNADYASTGSMYTLYVLKELLQEPFILLENDLLYEPACIDYLVQDATADIILASDATYSGDEVYIQCDEHRHLVNMSKNKSLLTHIDGELVGINKVSPELLDAMCVFAEQQYASGNHGLHYEDAMVGVSKQTPIAVKVVEGLVWCEIDDEQHLERALTKIYPKIQQRLLA